jgi:transcriptional regulator with XRE-family HTH domain
MSKTTRDQLVLAVQAQFYVKQLIKAGYSQREIAYQVGLSQANISRIFLKSENRRVKLSTQRKLAEVWEDHKMRQINNLENKDFGVNYSHDFGVNYNHDFGGKLELEDDIEMFNYFKLGLNIIKIVVWSFIICSGIILAAGLLFNLVK